MKTGETEQTIGVSPVVVKVHTDAGITGVTASPSFAGGIEYAEPLSVFLVGVTYDSFQRATTEEQIQDDVDEAIAAFDSDHRLERSSVQIVYPSSVPFQEPERVVVRVGIEPGASATGLATAINDRIEVTTDDDLVAKLQQAEAGDVLNTRSVDALQEFLDD